MAARFSVNGHHRPTETDDVVRTIVHIICKQPGCQIALPELKRKIRQQRLKLNENISTLLEDYCDNFNVTDSIVSANTTIEICPGHCSQKDNCVDSSCDKLHICKFFLISTCKFGTNSGVACEFGHDLDSTHNKQLLSEHLLDKLNVQEFQRLFQKGTNRSAITLPMICRYYNNIRDCSKKDACPHIHICQYYIQGSCKFGTACKRNHDITPRIKGILVKYGIDTSRRIRDILHDLRVSLPITNPTQQTMKRYTSMPMLSQRTNAAMSIPRNGPKLGRQRKPTECEGIENPSQERPGSLEICMYNLRRANGCWFKENCTGYHAAKKYQWQYLGSSDADWVDFDDYMNDKLDANYILVECDSCTVTTDGSDVDDSDSDEETSDVTVYFTNMEGVGNGRQFLVRRLSTASSATLNPRVARSFHAYVTRWCWFWYNDKQREWIEYGLPGDDGQRPDIDNDEIEVAFDRSPEGHIEFHVAQDSFTLRFSKMIQKNRKTKTNKRVRRRPVW